MDSKAKDLQVGAAEARAESLGRALLEASNEGLAAVDSRGMLLYANRRAHEVLGLEPGSSLVSAQPTLWTHASETLDDGQKRSGIMINFGEAAYRATLSIMPGDVGIGVVLCVFEAVAGGEPAARKMETLMELSRELDAIIDSSSDGLWITDEKGVVIRINPVSEEINHIRAEDYIGRDMRELVKEGFVNRSATLEVLKTRAPVNVLQQTSTGRKLMVSGRPVFDHHGELCRVVVTERDITEIDRLRRELEVKEAITDQFRQQLVQAQLDEFESQRIIARSPSMLRALQQALKVSLVDSTVLILGESGVGKGMFAELIHRKSSRTDQPMIKINCGAIPESLVESELFGYEGGAFTGALKAGKPGHLELADGGTLFLDEIAELPLSSQVRLLRFIEDGRVTRVGGVQSRVLNVRILAATNRDLEAMVADQKFRGDLYYRLNVIPIYIPPIRERPEDLLSLLHHYLQHFGAKYGSQKHFGQGALKVLLNYPFPGNVREIMNLCERLVVMSEDKCIEVDDLPAAVRADHDQFFDGLGGLPQGMTLKEMMDTVERNLLAEARKTHRNQRCMAEALGIDQSTIARKLKRHGLS